MIRWRKQGFLKVEALADSGGHQLPHIEYPHLSKAEMMGGVNRFYDEYYFRPRGGVAHRARSAVGFARAQAALS